MGVRSMLVIQIPSSLKLVSDSGAHSQPILCMMFNPYFKRSWYPRKESGLLGLFKERRREKSIFIQINDGTRKSGGVPSKKTMFQLMSWRARSSLACIINLSDYQQTNTKRFSQGYGWEFAGKEKISRAGKEKKKKKKKGYIFLRWVRSLKEEGKIISYLS